MKQKKLVWLLSVVTMFMSSYGINIAQQNQRIEEIKTDIQSNRLDIAQEKINELPANLAKGRIIKELEAEINRARKNKQGKTQPADSSSLIPQVPTPPAFVTKQVPPVPSAHDKPETPSYVKTSADAKAIADKTKDRPVAPTAPEAPIAPQAPIAPLAPTDLPSAGTKPTKAPTKPVSKPKPTQDFNQELLNKIKGRNKDQTTQSEQSPSSKPTTSSASPSPVVTPSTVFSPSQAPTAPDAPPLDSAGYPSAPQAPIAPLAPTDLPSAPTKASATISAKPNKPASQSQRSGVMDELNAKLKKRKEQAEQGSLTGMGTGISQQQASVASQGPTQDQQKSQAALTQGLAKIRSQVAPEDEEENDEEMSYQ